MSYFANTSCISCIHLCWARARFMLATAAARRIYCAVKLTWNYSEIYEFKLTQPESVIISYFDKYCSSYPDQIQFQWYHWSSSMFSSNPNSMLCLIWTNRFLNEEVSGMEPPFKSVMLIAQITINQLNLWQTNSCTDQRMVCSWQDKSSCAACMAKFKTEGVNQDQ